MNVLERTEYFKNQIKIEAKERSAYIIEFDVNTSKPNYWTHSKINNEWVNRDQILDCGAMALSDILFRQGIKGDQKLLIETAEISRTHAWRVLAGERVLSWGQIELCLLKLNLHPKFILAQRTQINPLGLIS